MLDTLITSGTELDTPEIELHPLMDAPTALHCEACGETVTPDGDCFNLGACGLADTLAARGNRIGRTGSFIQPRAWTFSGNVD